MATLAIRLSKGVALSRVFGPSLLARASPALGPGTNGPHQTLMTSPVAKARYYGPEEEHERVDDLRHWTNERYVALALIPTIPAALAYPNMYLDMLLCTGMVLHVHWRLSGVCQDYIHGQILSKIAKYGVLLLTIGTFGSLCYFNYYDVGFAKAARLLYSEL